MWLNATKIFYFLQLIYKNSKNNIFHIYPIFDYFPLFHCHLLHNNKFTIARKYIRTFFYFLLKYKLIFDNFLFLIKFPDCAEHNGLDVKQFFLSKYHFDKGKYKKKFRNKIIHETWQNFEILRIDFISCHFWSTKKLFYIIYFFYFIFLV